MTTQAACIETMLKELIGHHGVTLSARLVNEGLQDARWVFESGQFMVNHDDFFQGLVWLITIARKNKETNETNH